MLKLKLPATEEHESVELRMEHSLVSLHDWESLYKKPFYSKEPHEPEEMLRYIEYMVLNDELPPDGFERLTTDDFLTINAYINDKQTATTFREDSQKQSREIVTAELIYHWMISFNIPFEPCSRWHLNRLMTLIRVSGIKNTKPKPLTRAQQAEEYRRINAERKAKLGTTG